MKVRYRIVKGFPDYLVGNDGTIWSMKYGEIRRLRPEAVSKRGHQVINLCVGGIGHRRLVHRLVLEAFVGPCPPGMECCHEDDNPRNNQLTNLRWGTKKSNSADAIRNGRLKRGEEHGIARLNNQQVIEIKAELRNRNRSYKEMAAHYGVTRATIRRIRDGVTWLHIKG